jgi:hypothetical protein
MGRRKHLKVPKTNIIKRFERLSKYGFSLKYLAEVYARKGEKGIAEIERELEKLVGAKFS